ncbi:hypothetical protein RFI_19714, partial [Reticulomyxa filosa]
NVYVCICTICWKPNTDATEQPFKRPLQKSHGHLVACPHFCRILQGIYPAAISVDAQDMLSRIFMIDPDDRATIEEIIGHSWFNGNVPTREDLYAYMIDRSKKVWKDQGIPHMIPILEEMHSQALAKETQSGSSDPNPNGEEEEEPELAQFSPSPAPPASSSFVSGSPISWHAPSVAPAMPMERRVGTTMAESASVTVASQSSSSCHPSTTATVATKPDLGETDHKPMTEKSSSKSQPSSSSKSSSSSTHATTKTKAATTTTTTAITTTAAATTTSTSTSTSHRHRHRHRQPQQHLQALPTTMASEKTAMSPKVAERAYQWERQQALERKRRRQSLTKKTEPTTAMESSGGVDTNNIMCVNESTNMMSVTNTCEQSGTNKSATNTQSNRDATAGITDINTNTNTNTNANTNTNNTNIDNTTNANSNNKPNTVQTEHDSNGNEKEDDKNATECTAATIHENASLSTNEPVPIIEKPTQTKQGRIHQGSSFDDCVNTCLDSEMRASSTQREHSITRDFADEKKIGSSSSLNALGLCHDASGCKKNLLSHTSNNSERKRETERGRERCIATTETQKHEVVNDDELKQKSKSPDDSKKTLKSRQPIMDESGMNETQTQCDITANGPISLLIQHIKQVCLMEGNLSFAICSGKDSTAINNVLSFYYFASFFSNIFFYITSASIPLPAEDTNINDIMSINNDNSNNHINGFDWADFNVKYRISIRKQQGNIVDFQRIARHIKKKTAPFHL